MCISSSLSLYLACRAARNRDIAVCSPCTKTCDTEATISTLNSAQGGSVCHTHHMLSLDEVDELRVLGIVNMSAERDVMHREATWDARTSQGRYLIGVAHNFLQALLVDYRCMKAGERVLEPWCLQRSIP